MIDIPKLAATHPWMEDALCVQVDHDMFYPEKGEPTRHAKAVCAACPVRETCLQYALDNHERYGVWGGLSERERRKLMPALPSLKPGAGRPIEKGCGTSAGYKRHRRRGEEACRSASPRARTTCATPRRATKARPA